MSYDGDLPDESSGASVAHWVGFSFRVARIHPWRFLVVLAIGLGFTALFYATRTPLYRAETKILTQRQQAMPSISRAAMSDEAPTRTANELVRQRENLLAMLRQTDILPLSEQPAPQTGWRRLLNIGETPDSEEDAVDALVLRLDRAIRVTTGDGTITISVDWPDPQQACTLVQSAYQNFLEARQVQEISAIDEGIAMMQGRAAELQSTLDRVIMEVQGTLPRISESPAPSASPLASPLPLKPSESLVRLRAALDAKSRAIRDLEDLRSRRLAELQGQLIERRSVLSEAHPTVVALKGEINGLSRESAQVATLLEEEARLREEYASQLAIEEPRGSSSGRARSSERMSSRTSALAASSAVNENERVRDARFRLTQVLERLHSAQLELDSTRAAFRHRYRILWPAQVPRKPVSPSPLRVFGIGSLLSVLVAFATVTLPFARSGRIMERWQLEKTLGVPVLADLGRK